MLWQALATISKAMMWLAIAGLLLGLWRPWWVLWWRTTQNRLQVIGLYGTLILVFYLTNLLARLVGGG